MIFKLFNPLLSFFQIVDDFNVSEIMSTLKNNEQKDFYSQNFGTRIGEPTNLCDKVMFEFIKVLPKIL